MTESKKNNWEVLGRLLAIIVALFTEIKKVHLSKGVGLDILDWLLAEGKQDLQAALSTLAENYICHRDKLFQSKIVWGKSTREYFSFSRIIDRSPLSGESIIINDRQHTYIDGRKLVAIRCKGYLSSKSITDGNDLETIIRERTLRVLPAILLDFFQENPEFWPEDMKDDIRVVFWDTTIEGAMPFCYKRVGRWNRSDESVVVQEVALSEDFSNVYILTY